MFVWQLPEDWLSLDPKPRVTFVLNALTQVLPPYPPYLPYTTDDTQTYQCAARLVAGGHRNEDFQS